MGNALLTHTLASFWRKQSCQICVGFCCALFCCGSIGNSFWFMWYIFPCYSGLLHGHYIVTDELTPQIWVKLTYSIPNRSVKGNHIWQSVAIYMLRCYLMPNDYFLQYDDVIRWKHFPRYWQFVRGIHRSPVNSPHKDQWRGALMFSLICFWINSWVNSGGAGDLRRYRAHYDVIAMNSFAICSAGQDIHSPVHFVC